MSPRQAFRELAIWGGAGVLIGLALIGLAILQTL